MDSNKEFQEVNDRIDFLIKELGMNPNSFAIAIGVENPVIYNIVKGRRTKPSFDVLSKMLLAFDSINPEWLILGKGKIFKQGIFSTEMGSLEGSLEGSQMVLNEPNLASQYSELEKLRKENMILKAQIEALYRAFKEIGSSSADESSRSEIA